MSKPFKLAAIGLDTSHTVAFTQRIQGKGHKKIRGLQVVSCLRFPSPFQTEPQQDDRQAQMEAMGVKVTRNLKEAVEGVDGIMLEINDPALHWSYFKKVAELKLPIFLDKPMAKNMTDAKKIYDLAKRKRLKVWEASSLRYSPDLVKAKKQAGDVELANIYGAMGKAAAGSSVVWYGCHTFQMLHSVMGGKARRIHATQGERGVVATVEFAKGRRGVIESISGNWAYGGRLHGKSGVIPFNCEGDLYGAFMPALRDFFLKGVVPTPLKDSLEVQLWLDAAVKSIERGKPIKLK